MKQNIMNKPIVLQLNANWMPVHNHTVKDAIIAMNSDGSKPPALALDIAYEKDENGEWDFSNPSYINPVGWEDFINLPIREYDLTVSTAKFTMRAPTILIAPEYRKVPMRTPRATKFNVYERDGGVCQYTGEKVPKGSGNIDHVISRAKGGKNSWENMVWCKSIINSKKGDKLPHEVGLKLIRKPKAPSGRPITSLFREARHPSWIPFLMSK